MSFNLTLTAEAREDVLHAYNYYEDVQTGLGEAFLDILEHHYSILIENPYLYSFIDTACILRDVKVLRFPYVIIYEVVDSTVIIYTIHNTYTKPSS